MMSTQADSAKFNVIFIDGGHTYDVALADIVNMRTLANQSYHTIVVDDANSADVRAAWDYAEHTLKIVKLREVYSASWSWCVNLVGVSAGILAGSYEFVACPGTEDDLSIQELIVGEYVW